MIRREFLRLLGALPFLGLVNAKEAPKAILPFHACVWRRDGTIESLELDCFCGHKIKVPSRSQDKEIVGCSVCGKRVQLHIIA